MTKNTAITTESFNHLVAELKQSIREAQHRALQSVNKELTALYWVGLDTIIRTQRHVKM